MEYSELAGFYEVLENTPKRLDKTKVISEIIKKTSDEDVSMILLLLEGRIFQKWDERETGVASRMAIKAISAATGISPGRVETEWSRRGDLGNTAEALVKVKRQATLNNAELSVKKVFSNLRKLPEIEGAGAVERKTRLVTELLASANPVEARYIIRTALQDLRVGVGEGSIRDAIIFAYFGGEIGLKESKDGIEIGKREEYNRLVARVQDAIDIANDFSSVIVKLRKKGIGGLDDIEIRLGWPLKVMLALKVDSAKEGFERCGRPAVLEYKYDGFRMQIHKSGKDVNLFTRRLENVTIQFPEVAGNVRENIMAETAILDCEAVGFDKKTGKYMPFQSISQRIKRKYGIRELSEQLPVEVNVFDILYYNGKSIIHEPYQKRHEIVNLIVRKQERRIIPARSIIADDEEKANDFFRQALKAGNEGVMFKNLKGVYKPGARVGHMVKWKPAADTLDLAIVGAEWGEGKRAKWLSSFTLACVGNEGDLLEVGKASTGLKEKDEEGLSFGRMTEALKGLIKLEKGREVSIRPKLVLEVGYSEIQKSPTYSSGYALRFPIIKSLREDRMPEDSTTLEEIEQLYRKQKR